MGIFRKKQSQPIVSLKSSDAETISTPKGGLGDKGWNIEDLFVSPYVCGTNFMQLFRSVPEVFFPIDYIASRIAGSDFQLKKSKDDSIVWENKRMNQILTKPNCLLSWKELIYQHFVYKLCTGNAFMRAAMAENLSDAPKFKYCSNYWELPADLVSVEPVSHMDVPLFGIAEEDEIIRCYRLEYGVYNRTAIPPFQVWHDRDGAPDFTSGRFLKGHSRLASHLKNISNLIAVYEARNVIYVKRGALGFLVSQKVDDGGTTAMTPDEKKNIIDSHFGKYGVDGRHLPYGISDVPLSFVRTNLSITELQPFEETLTDAIQIAGAFGIPSVLVPRKDQSTFSNQATAEKAVYTSVIIPMAKHFCRRLTAFLSLEEAGYYLDCNFDSVDCLQQGMKEKEEVKTLVNNRCKEQFNSGLISINDWRAQIGESKFEEELFDKTLFEMSDEERERVNKILSLNTKSEEEGNGKRPVPAVQNQGK